MDFEYNFGSFPPHQTAWLCPAMVERNSKVRKIKSKEDTDKEVGSKKMSVNTGYGENKC